MSPINIASTVPFHASQMYAKNISTFLRHIIKDGQLMPPGEDQIVTETLVTYDGEVVNARIREFLQLPAKEEPVRRT
jgi:NAD(P) transhydrogenase subunit alpha